MRTSKNTSPALNPSEVRSIFFAGRCLVVAIFGAIVLGSLPADLAPHVSVENLASSFAAAGRDIGSVFRWVFIAAIAGLLVALVRLYLMEERPLRTHAQPAGAAE